MQLIYLLLTGGSNLTSRATTVREGVSCTGGSNLTSRTNRVREAQI